MNETMPGSSGEGNEPDPDNSQLHESKKKAKTSGKATTAPPRFAAMAKALGARWKSLPPSERRQYQDSAAQDQKRYRSEMAEYREKIIRGTAIGAAYLDRKEKERQVQAETDALPKSSEVTSEDSIPTSSVPEADRSAPSAIANLLSTAGNFASGMDSSLGSFEVSNSAPMPERAAKPTVAPQLPQQGNLLQQQLMLLSGSSSVTTSGGMNTLAELMPLIRPQESHENSLTDVQTLLHRMRQSDQQNLQNVHSRLQANDLLSLLPQLQQQQQQQSPDGQQDIQSLLNRIRQEHQQQTNLVHTLSAVMQRAHGQPESTNQFTGVQSFLQRLRQENCENPHAALRSQPTFPVANPALYSYRGGNSNQIDLLRQLLSEGAPSMQGLSDATGLQRLSNAASLQRLSTASNVHPTRREPTTAIPSSTTSVTETLNPAGLSMPSGTATQHLQAAIHHLQAAAGASAENIPTSEQMRRLLEDFK
jgi:HMG (high mobility group) box